MSEKPAEPTEIPSEGDEGSRPAQATPPIGDDAAHGQTQTPAPADDTGVPPDEEMNRDDEEE